MEEGEMNLRERFADWLTGGALTRAWDNADVQAENRKESIDILCRCIEAVRYQRNAYSNSLQQIADMETPSANATVRRIAKVAREALDDTPKLHG